MKLLYAEDEKSMSDAVVDILEFNKYLVDAVYNGRDALDYAMAEKYDGIILDIMMPGLSGLEVLKALREKGNNTPVLLLTAKGEIEDQVEGLDLGADDYLPKPFASDLLLARVRAMLRRKEEFTPTVLKLGNTQLNQQSFELIGPESQMVLPKIEYQIIEALMLNTLVFLSSEDLITKVWGYETTIDTNAIFVYISYLRKKLAAVGSTVQIISKRNLGYKLEVE